MKNLFRFLFIILLASILLGCNDDPEPEPEPKVEYKKDTITQEGAELLEFLGRQWISFNEEAYAVRNTFFKNDSTKHIMIDQIVRQLGQGGPIDTFLITGARTDSLWIKRSVEDTLLLRFHTIGTLPDGKFTILSNADTVGDQQVRFISGN